MTDSDWALFPVLVQPVKLTPQLQAQGALSRSHAALQRIRTTSMSYMLHFT